MKHILKAAAAIALTGMLFIPELPAQGGLPNMFAMRKGKKRTAQATKITALTMDIDILNNQATLLGNVVVDDQELKITCNKMILYLEEKQEEPEKAGGKSRKKTKSDDPAGGKQLKKIECMGDVVITRPASSDESPDKEQSATAGKAVYDMKANTITLTEKPVLRSGTDKVVASRIVVLVNEGGRLQITKGTLDYQGDGTKFQLPGMQ